MPGLGDLAGRPAAGRRPWRQDLSGLGISASPACADLISPYAGTLAQDALAVLLAVLSGLAEVLVAIFLAFFLYRDGPAIAQRAEAALERLAGDQTRHLVELIGGVTRGVVYGLLGTAVVQGMMTTFGLWISRRAAAGAARRDRRRASRSCRSARRWSGFRRRSGCSRQGQTGWAIFLGLYGAFGISSADNVIRPWLITRGADLPLLLTLLGALGGVFAFGFLGLFLGPVLLAVGFTLLKDWADEAVGPPERAGLRPFRRPSAADYRSSARSVGMTGPGRRQGDAGEGKGGPPDRRGMAFLAIGGRAP